MNACVWALKGWQDLLSLSLSTRDPKSCTGSYFSPLRTSVPASVMLQQGWAPASHIPALPGHGPHWARPTHGPCPSLALVHPYPQGGAQFPGLGLPPCHLAPLLQSRLMQRDAALVAPWLYFHWLLNLSVNEQLKRLWKKYGKSEVTCPKGEEKTFLILPLS